MGKDSDPEFRLRKILRSSLLIEQATQSASHQQVPESIKDRRSVVNQNTDPDVQDGFSLVSYNCLVDWHAREDYGSRVEPQFLDADVRHARILEELAILDGDIVCLQEVTPDFYKNTLTCWFRSRGYHASYIQRIHGRTDEGSAMFYKKDKFLSKMTDLIQFKTFSDEIINSYSLPAERYTMEQEAIIHELELTGTNHVIVVATTHLLFGDFKRPDVQILQISHLKHILKRKYGGKCSILCGDFNFEPGSLPYTFSTTGHLSDYHWKRMPEHSDIKDRSDLFELIRKITEDMDTNEEYGSAYAVVLGKEPDVTCVDHVVRCTLDYVLFRESESTKFSRKESSVSKHCLTKSRLVPLSVLDTMPLQEVMKELPPSRVYPSDHFPLFVKFALIHEEQFRL